MEKLVIGSTPAAELKVEKWNLHPWPIMVHCVVTVYGVTHRVVD